MYTCVEIYKYLIKISARWVLTFLPNYKQKCISKQLDTYLLILITSFYFYIYMIVTIR